MKPVIGICVDYVPDPKNKRAGGGKLSLNWNYAQAVAEAGGVPLLVPPQADPAEILAIIDGLLIPGGNDIDAKNWGEENHPSVEPIAPERFEGEQKLLAVAAKELPVLGICYGCQFINVSRGGSLIQHLPDVEGVAVHTGGAPQNYEFAEGSKLAAALGGRTARGESWHHQAIDRVGDGLRVVGRNVDGVIEAVEATDSPWMIGVQWHPERTPDDSATQDLFKAFVAGRNEIQT